MPHYGPWLTAPPQTVTAELPNVGGPGEIMSGTSPAYTSLASSISFADACEPSTPLAGGSGSMTANDVIPGSLDAQCGQARFTVTLASLVPYNVDYSPALPPDAISVDYDTDSADRFDWITSAVQFTMLVLDHLSPNSPPLVNDTIVARAYPGSASPVEGWNGFTGTSDLTNAGIVGSVDIDNVTPDAQWLCGVTVPLSAARPSSHDVWMFLHYQRQIPKTAPAQFVQRRAGPDHGATFPFPGSVTWTYQPRRYRFLYDTLAPLRQFPRDDTLDGAPRQGKTNGPTSVQGSARQGWRATYR